MWTTVLDLPTRLEENFSEIDNDIVADLQDSSDAYSELHQQLYFRGHTDAVEYLKKIKAI